MFNQHAKWLSISKDLSWREEISSLNLLITSTVWRQDKCGFHAGQIPRDLLEQAVGILPVRRTRHGKDGD
jgi:phosphoketolase